MIPGKLDCNRISLRRRSRFTHIIFFVTFLCFSHTGTQAQSAPPEYPEVGWLGRSTYCNPYFGFRLALPAGFKSETIYLPVQPQGRHMLLATHLQRLDRSADLLISAFEDQSDDPAHLAAKARARQAHHGGLTTTGPTAGSIHDHRFYRLHIASGTPNAPDESSYFFMLRGYVVHFAVFAHEHELSAAIEAAIGRLEFVEPGSAACVVPADSSPNVAVPRLYYGPALPTELVESTVRAQPGYSIPSGEFSHGAFTSPALGVRVELPPHWQPIPSHDAFRITELMRDPTSDPGSSDRRRALFRACSRVIFAAADSETELIAEVHPGIALVAMAQGCVPDMVMPAGADDHAASEELATVLARSLGVPLLTRGSARVNAQGGLTFDLDGTLPYQVPGEKLSRRLSLRVSATASGRWFIFVFSATSTPAAQREIESRISIGPAPAGTAP